MIIQQIQKQNQTRYITKCEIARRLVIASLQDSSHVTC